MALECDFRNSLSICSNGINFQLNLSILKFLGMGHGCGQRVHFEILGLSFLNSSLNLWLSYQFSAKSENLEFYRGIGSSPSPVDARGVKPSKC